MVKAAVTWNQVYAVVGLAGIATLVTLLAPTVNVTRPPVSSILNWLPAMSAARSTSVAAFARSAFATRVQKLTVKLPAIARSAPGQVTVSPADKAK